MEKKVSEYFLSLALNPNTGYFRVTGNYFTYGIIGALLMDLALNGNIELDGKMLKVKQGTGLTGMEVYDRALETFKASSKERSIRYWLRKLSYRSVWYRKELVKLHTKNRVLREERKRFLGIPYYLRYPADRVKTKKLAIRFKEIVIYNRQPDEAELMFIGLLYACKMHRVIADVSSERKKVRKALVKYIRENPAASGVSKTISEMQAAITASIAAAVIASSSASTMAGK